MPTFFRATIAAVLTALAFQTSAATSPPGVDAQTLRRPLPLWSQADREFGFAHYEQIYTMRAVARGPQVHALPAGAPLSGLKDGSEGARQLQSYIDNYKLSGILILQDGKIRLERYALGHSAAGRWASFSMAKSMTSTLVGAAIKDGFIKNVDDPVTQYIPELRGSAYEGVSVRQLLTMTSGVKWNKDYTDVNSDVMQFYAVKPDPGMDQTVSYMRKLKREAPPGEKWLYKTGETNLIGVLVAQATNKELAAYLSEKSGCLTAWNRTRYG